MKDEEEEGDEAEAEAVAVAVAVGSAPIEGCARLDALLLGVRAGESDSLLLLLLLLRKEKLPDLVIR